MDDTPVAGHPPRSKSQRAALLPRLALIAAVSRNRVIGANNRMPWHLPADLRNFRGLTEGHSVIMGRRTFDSMGRALPRRQNIVVSRNPGLVLPGCVVADSLVAALERCTMPEPVFCIGGAELYRQALPFAGEIHLTEINADFDGDTFMPPIAPGDWREVARETATDPASGLEFAFVHLIRATPGAAIDPITVIPN